MVIVLNTYSLYEKLPVEEYPIRLSLKNEKVDFPPHWHEYTEIHFAKRGSFSMNCANRSYVLKENDCVIVNANELHEGVGENCDDFVIMIHPAFFDNNYVIFKHFLNDNAVTDMMYRIIEEYENKGQLSRLAIKGYTYQLVTYLGRNYAIAEMSEGNYKAFSEKYKTVNKAAEFINNHYYENITTGFLSDLVHLSQSHFCHIFKEITGKSAKEFLINVRIERASDLLRSTDMNITEIAFACGFLDANYFARAFKKIRGMNPTEYKKSEKERKL